MSSLCAGSRPAQERALRDLITKLSASPVEFPLTCPSFTALSPTLLSSLFPHIISLLQPPYTRSTLSIVLSLIQSAPPAVIAPNLPTLSTRLVALLSRSSANRAPIFATLATLLLHPLPPPADLPLTHALRAFDDQQPKTVYAALSVVAAVLNTAPRQIRTVASALDRALVDLFVHEERRIRTLAATIWGTMVCVAGPEKWNRRIQFVIERLSDVQHVLDVFAGGKDGMRAVHADVKVMNGLTMARYYEAMSSALNGLWQVDMEVEIPWDKLIPVLLASMTQWELDMYTVLEGVAVDVEGVLLVADVVRNEAAPMLKATIISLGKGALAWGRVLGGGIGRWMKRMCLKINAHGGTLFLKERRAMYEVAEEGIGMFGGGFVQSIVDSFVVLFEKEIMFYYKCKEAEKKPEMRTKESWRGRKKRKRRRGRDIVTDVNEIDISEKNRISSLIAPETTEQVQEAMDAALRTCTALFDDRSLLDENTVKGVEKLEDILSKLAKSTISETLMEALRAAALSGGSKRAERGNSVLLDVCTDRLQEIAVGYEAGKNRRLASSCKAVCGTMFQPRSTQLLSSSEPVLPGENGVPDSGGRIGNSNTSGSNIEKQAEKEHQKRKGINERDEVMKAPESNARPNQDLPTTSGVSKEQNGESTSMGRSNKEDVRELQEGKIDVEMSDSPDEPEQDLNGSDKRSQGATVLDVNTPVQSNPKKDSAQEDPSPKAVEHPITANDMSSARPIDDRGIKRKRDDTATQVKSIQQEEGPQNDDIAAIAKDDQALIDSLCFDPSDDEDVEK